MSYNPSAEFYIPGTFDPTETWPENERTLHQGGLDKIAPAFDPNTVLSGISGSEQAESETKELPQWGPPFVSFVDYRLTELEKKVIHELEKWQFKTRTDYFIASMMTDGSGNVNPLTNGNASLYEPPPGFTFALHRICIALDGSSFGSPFTGAGDYWELRIGNEMIDGGSLVSGQGSLPVVRTWGTRDALRVRDGEILTLFVNGVTANKRITVKGQGSLDRTTEG